MTERPDTASDVLKHARQIHFALVITCIVIILTVIFQSDSRLLKAERQLQNISDLRDFWNENVNGISGDSNPIASVFGLIPNDEAYALIAFDTEHPSTPVKINGDKTLKNDAPCILGSHIFHNMYPMLNNGQLVRLDVGAFDGFERYKDSYAWIKDGESTFFHQNLSIGSIKTINEFKIIWNLLDTAKWAVRFDKIPNQTALGLFQPFAAAQNPATNNVYFLTIPELSPSLISPQSYERIQHQDHIENSPEAALGSYFHNIFRGDIEQYREQPSLADKFETMVVRDRYYFKSFCSFVDGSAAAQNSEFSYKNTAYGGFLIEISTKKSPLNWQNAWIQISTDTGFISTDTGGVRQGSFSESFPELNEFSQGLQALNINNINSVLEKELSEQGKEIEIAGLKLGPAIVRNAGTFVILTIQIYLFIHLLEALSRMRCEAKASKASFVPWVLLYRGRGPRSVALLISCILPVATAVVLFYWSLDLSHWSFANIAWTLVTTGGICLVVYFAYRTARISGELSEVAAKHRDFAFDDDARHG